MKQPFKVLFVFGTRPEAIKMAPVVKVFSQNTHVQTKVCVTAQHREMLDQVLRFFNILPDYDLNLMQPGQTLHELTAKVIVSLKDVLEEYKPHYVFVHGDTTTSMAASLAAFYCGCKVVHIEAGLRTYDKRHPFPEELNRQITARIADVHFAPTPAAKNNLCLEHISEERIYVTGNTVIDALFMANDLLKTYEDSEIITLKKLVVPGKKLILVTGHRRENFGQGFLNICEALKEIALEENVQIIYPVHLNPNVQEPVFTLLGEMENIHLIKPIGYPAFVWLMQQTYLIITDSGGVQEEAPSLGKPVLVMRNTTERPEAVENGTVKMVGTDKTKIINYTKELLNHTEAYKQMSRANNPYGDGLAAQRIKDILLSLCSE